MENLTKDHYRGLIIECYSNAKQFIQDAELLLANNSPGHAYALGIIGLEELSKVIIAFDVALGVRVIDDVLVRHIFDKHLQKHEIIFNSLLLTLFNEWFESTPYKEVFLVFRNDFLSGAISEESFQRKIIDLIEQDTSTEESDVFLHFLDEYLDFQKDKKLIETKRQLGFYVDFNFRTGEISSPKYFTKPLVQERIETYKALIEYYSDTVNILSDRKLQNKIIKPLYATFKTLFQK